LSVEPKNTRLAPTKPVVMPMTWLDRSAVSVCASARPAEQEAEG
jgi:hypothetical protein